MHEAQAYTLSEARINDRSRHSEHEDMNRVLSRCRASFFRSAHRFLENAADAEDAVQDALVSACKHIDQFRGEAQISTWLTAIVLNSARMQLRKRGRQILVSLDEPIGEEQEHSMSEQLADCRPSPEDECRTSELQARLEELATQLSPSLRRTFQLRDLEGLTTSEAAHLLGVPEGTVKARLARARTKLRGWMRRGIDPRVNARLNSRRSSMTLRSVAKK